MAGKLNWGALSHAFGSAADIPGIIKLLSDPSPATQESAYERLRARIFFNNQRTDVTYHAIPLVGIAIQRAADMTKAWLICLLVDIALGDSKVHITTGFRATSEQDNLFYQTVEAEVSSWLDYLEDREPNGLLCGAAIYAFGWFPRFSTLSRPLLRNIAMTNDPATIFNRMNAIMALALLNTQENAYEEDLSLFSSLFSTLSEHRYLKMVAAIAFLKVSGQAPTQQVRDILFEALDFEITARLELDKIQIPLEVWQGGINHVNSFMKNMVQTDPNNYLQSHLCPEYRFNKGDITDHILKALQEANYPFTERDLQRIGYAAMMTRGDTAFNIIINMGEILAKSMIRKLSKEHILNRFVTIAITLLFVDDFLWQLRAFKELLNQMRFPTTKDAISNIVRELDYKHALRAYKDFLNDINPSFFKELILPGLQSLNL